MSDDQTDAGTVNGVAVPAGMTLEQFQLLVTARQGVAGDLANAFLAENLATQSDAYFDSLGHYFVRELLAQAPTDSPLASRMKFYAESHAVEEITPEMDTIARDALANVAVPATPKPVIVDAGPAPIGASGAAMVAVNHRGSFLQIIGDDFHAVVMKVARWIDAL